MAIAPIRAASRALVRELGFLGEGLAGTALPPSAVHALIEIGAGEGLTAASLGDRLGLEKSSVSRMLRKLVLAGEVAAGRSPADGRAKPLALTAQGRASLARIDAFAERQVAGALRHLPATRQQVVADGLAAYAAALAASRTGRPPAAPVAIEPGYRPGALGACAALHGRTYARLAGFGREFEALVAAALAEFSARLDRPGNRLFLALQGEAILGTIAIDGEDLGPGIAHLRWFAVEEGLRGTGLGRRLLDTALGFCDRAGFAETQLWTFRGLDAARHLYEAAGFTLAEERPGRQWGAEVMEQRFRRRLGP